MITARAFAGKHFAVLGLARSGLATVKALLASGAKVTAWDDKEEARSSLSRSDGEGDHPQDGGGASNVSASAPPPPASLAVPLPTSFARREELVIADFTTADLSQFDSIVVTPGLPLNRHPIAARAREAGVEIIGDIELFARARPELPSHKVVGITGTNGKSTTTALVHHILRTAGVPATMGGNIGLPILAQDPLPKGGVYVLELSSYQIDLTQSLDCDVAVLLNITPDHLDRYDSFEAYAASKWRIVEMQGVRQLALVGVAAFLNAPPSPWNYKSVIENIEDTRADVETPQELELIKGMESTDNFRGVLKEIDEIRGERIAAIRAGWPNLQGPHNGQNAQAGIAACRALGVTEDTITEALRTFPGLPHRMERVSERNGVIFVNDSKATNAEAAAPALAAYPRVRWIVGGQAKSDSLGDTAAQLGHVVAAYTIGEAGPMFAGLLRDAGVAVVECETLENAVKRAAEDSQPGETVLLSPAAASFDQYRDFEARGDQFRELVGAL